MSTYKRRSKKTGNNSRRTVTQNANGSRTVSNSRKYSTGSRKTISHNSKTGRTRTTYTVKNGGGWISRSTSVTGGYKSRNTKSRSGRRGRRGSVDRRSGGSVGYVEYTFGEMIRVLLVSLLIIVAYYGGIALLLVLGLYVMFG